MSSVAGQTTHHLDICVGRQPIYDRHRKVIAYELLFRRPNANSAGVSDGEQATAQVILNTLMEIGIDRVAGDQPVFLNCTRSFLEGDPLIPPDLCVLEVLEDISLDERLVNNLRALKEQGYRIALDDFVYRPRFDAVVEIADFVKVDLTLLTQREVERQTALLRRFPARLIAEKIDSEQQFQFCQKIGFDYFQGYFLRRPDVLSTRRAPSYASTTLWLVRACEDPAADVHTIAQAIARDPGLSYKLLQLVNSCLLDNRAPVDSIGRAIQVAGTDLILRWALLLLIAGFDDSPPSYVMESLRRARMCETLARAQTLERPERAYIMGLLSVPDSILNQPMADILEPLPLAADLKAAMLLQEGPFGRILRDVIAWESENSDALSSGCPDLKLVEGAFWEAVGYSKDMSRSILPS